MTQHFLCCLFSCDTCCNGDRPNIKLPSSNSCGTHQPIKTHLVTTACYAELLIGSSWRHCDTKFVICSSTIAFQVVLVQNSRRIYIETPPFSKIFSIIFLLDTSAQNLSFDTRQQAFILSTMSAASFSLARRMTEKNEPDMLRKYNCRLEPCFNPFQPFFSHEILIGIFSRARIQRKALSNVSRAHHEIVYSAPFLTLLLTLLSHTFLYEHSSQRR